MPLLAYCIIETAASVQISPIGLNGVPIEALEHNGLRCLVSQSNEILPAPGGTIRDSALAFHHVLNAIFRQVAIIPFRFPTIFPDQNEVASHLAEHSLKYRSALDSLRNMVQMEIGIHINDSLSAEETTTAAHPKLTGMEYLQQMQARHARLDSAANDFRKSCAGLTKGWKQKDAAAGLRCFALIARTAIDEFRNAAAAAMHNGFAARISGPWPATQFLIDK